jgi:protein MPE1
MSSSVFYKFKNSREPERIVFNGTGISVFELKREIIVASGLGDGTDFNLHIYPEDDLTSEYKDDTSLIPRSATVICVRRPAPRGQGRAARYISGKAPVRAIVRDTTKAAPAPAPVPRGGHMSEADAEAAFLAESAQVWDAQKESLSHVKPTYNKNKKPVNVPNHDPPPGYVCRRCNVKGHWIQACPTNDDPDFKPVFQAKRTTGIPRSFLKTVEKPEDEEAAKGVMRNADGEYVQVMPDTKTWEKFQEKTNASKAQAASADAASKEMRERGLECSIDKRRFVDPVKTPCCGKTYCRECIDNALADGDLICPNCGKEEVLMDDLVSDEDMVSSLQAFDAEKAKEKADREEASKAVSSLSESSPNEENVEVSKTQAQAPLSPTEKEHSDSDSTASNLKRKDPPTTIMPPSAPKAMRQQANPTPNLEQTFIQEMEALKNGQPPMAMAMPMMGMPPMPNMGMPFQPPNMGYGNMGFGAQQGYNNMGGYGMGMMGNQNQMGQQGWGQQGMNMNMNMNMMNNGNGVVNGGMGGMGMVGQNDAYERQPVNNRQRNRRNRAPDYRYL